MPYEKLRARLLADGQVLEYASAPKPAEKGTPALDVKKLAGVIVDDNDAVVTGDWETSHVVGPFVGTGYRHDGAAGKGAKSVRFEAKLPSAGRYEVRFSYTPNTNRCKAVPVSVLVPGHGPVMSDHTYTRQVRELMEAVTTRVAELARQGKTLEQVQAAVDAAEVRAKVPAWSGKDQDGDWKIILNVLVERAWRGVRGQG